jgi:Holliday junction resolvase
VSNRNYIKGRAFEYRVAAYLRNRGYYVQRSYGSKGVFDLLAISSEKHGNHRPLAIQAKNLRGKLYIAPAERLQLAEASRKYNAHVCICWNENGKLKWKLVSPYN